MRDHELQRDGPSRRDVMAGTAASALALSTPAFAHAETMATGFVFEDRSGTGIRRPGDRGIAGVMVSNGRDVVTTAPDGSWRLPLTPGDSIFVIKPPYWATPIGTGGVPLFSYLHHPEGTPARLNVRHAGVAPTGPLPHSIDFGLTRTDEKPQFEALLLTDTQPQTHQELDYLRDDIIAGLIGRGAAFGINHGDVMFDDLSLYPRYLRLLGLTGIPWHHCPGNHDLNPEAANDHYSRETWKRIFGPRHYAFQYAAATFIMLDNVRYLGRGGYRGEFGERQLQFVRNVLANVPPDRLVVLSMHIPLVNATDPWAPAETTADRKALLALLSGRQHTVSFSGHMHTTEHHYLGREHGFTRSEPHHHHVLTAASGAWWSGPLDRRGVPSADSTDGTPNGFHILSVDGNAYTTTFIPAAEKTSTQLRVLVRDTASTHPELIVNVFDGGPRTSVTYTIGRDISPVVMVREPAVDPYIIDLFKHARRKPWVEPVASSHLRRAPLPPLGPGAHDITVRVNDEYGREHASHLVLEADQAGHPARPV
jgi:hypothetical protein